MCSADGRKQDGKPFSAFTQYNRMLKYELGSLENIQYHFTCCVDELTSVNDIDIFSQSNRDKMNKCHEYII